MLLRLCRFKLGTGGVHVGLLHDDGSVVDLSNCGVTSLTSVLEMDEAEPWLRALIGGAKPEQRQPGFFRLLCPVERQEVWAAGVTYQPSRVARMEESPASASCYDRVYKADRPELFFKSVAEKVVGHQGSIGIRADSRWSVPEPELAIVCHSRGRIVGYTIGNDVSARDIEGQNPLYLPQAKIYDKSCAIGPGILVGADEATVRTWRVEMTVRRGESVVFSGSVEIGRMQRRFDDLIKHLFRCQKFPNGVVLLTGTGIVPPPEFTLQPGDTVRIGIGPLGLLENTVERIEQ